MTLEEAKRLIGALLVTTDGDWARSEAEAILDQLAPRWISCETEMPPEDEEVILFCNRWGKPMVGNYKFARKHFELMFDNPKAHIPTHWLRLPTPPAKEGA